VPVIIAGAIFAFLAITVSKGDIAFAATRVRTALTVTFTFNTSEKRIAGFIVFLASAMLSFLAAYAFTQWATIRCFTGTRIV
jgi:hypothetical protein